MPVDQDRQAESLARLHQKPVQRAVIGPVHRLDPPPRLGEGKLAGVDLLPFRTVTTRDSSPGRGHCARALCKRA